MSELSGFQVNIDNLVRARRRTIGLQIGTDGALTVRAPVKTPLFEIYRVIESKKKWILRKQEYFLKKKMERVTRQYAEGEMVLLQGRTYPMVFGSALRKVTFDGFIFRVQHKERDNLKKLFQKWYKTKALEVIEPRCRHYAGLMGLRMPPVSIGRATSRWGSCNPKGALRFCYRLVLAPPEVVDLVVVHELAHIKVRNHSSDFYKEMSRWLPGHGSINKWLSRYSHLLDPEIVPLPKLPSI